MSKYRLEENIDISLWDSFVEESPQGTIFCKSEFLNCLEPNKKIYGVYKGQELVLATVLLLDENSLPLKSPYYFTPYQGILYKNLNKLAEYKQIEEKFNSLEFVLNELGGFFDNLSFANSSELHDVRPFLWHNYNNPENGKFIIDIRYTSILNIANKTFDDYLKDIKSARRQEYSKSKNYKIEETEDVDLLDRLHEATFIKNNVGRSNTEKLLLKTITQAAIKNKFGRLSVINTDSGPASCYLFIKDSKRSYYLFAGNDPEQRNGAAATALMLDNIKYSKEVWKLPEVDFVGCNSPQRAYFKLSFNGEIKTYFETYYSRSTN